MTDTPIRTAVMKAIATGLVLILFGLFLGAAYGAMVLMARLISTLGQ